MGLFDSIFKNNSMDKVMDVNCNIPNRTFKERSSLAERKADSFAIRLKFPDKVPIIVERYKDEKTLPIIDKVKFLVPSELTLSQFAAIVKSRLSLNSTETFYLFTNSSTVPSLSMTVLDMDEKFKDIDGFLYLTYTSQEVFG